MFRHFRDAVVDCCNGVFSVHQFGDDEGVDWGSGEFADAVLDDRDVKAENVVTNDEITGV